MRAIINTKNVELIKSLGADTVIDYTKQDFTKTNQTFDFVFDVIFLKELVVAGRYKPVIDRKYRLEQIVDAYKYVESGQKTGNVLITLIY